MMTTHSMSPAAAATAPPAPLITAEALMALAAERRVVIDTSFDLADPAAGEQSWREGHLPGSVYLHLERDLCGPKTGSNGRHPLPARADFARTLGACGIGPASFVVAVDRQGAMFAARLWWMLRWMGHAQVAVLDGGVAAWTAAGGLPTTEATATVALPAYPTNLPPCVGTVDADGLAARLGRIALLDARAGERFRGEVEPLDRQPGHIPGALHHYFKENLEPDGRFRAAEDLRADFDRLLGNRPPAEVVHQCGSGVTACHNLLAMAHAGLDGSLLYPGSWSEWSSDPARPVARGG